MMSAYIFLHMLDYGDNVIDEKNHCTEQRFWFLCASSVIVAPNDDDTCELHLILQMML